MTAVAAAAVTGRAAAAPGQASAFTKAATPAAASLRPSEKIRLLLSAISTLDPADTARMFMTGTCHGGFADGSPPKPLFGVSMLIVGRVFTQGGRFRQTSNQLVLFSDLDSGRIIDKWRNPYINEDVSVFHGHNGPQDIEFDVAKLDLAVNDKGGAKIGASLDIDWKENGPFARTEISVTSKRKNPLDPVKWPREYSGESLDVREWSQWVIPVDSISRTPALPSLSCLGSTQRFANWYPWMLMGQRSGYLYTHLTGQKLGSEGELPAAFLAYAQKNFRTYLEAPKMWTGKFVDIMSVFMSERSPAAAGP